jgi:hypothetical protein
MILNWFNTREVNELAQTIVDELLKRYPPDGKDFDLKKSTERLRKTHDSIFARVNTFARSAKLNTYKIAHLGNQTKWALKEAGYPKEFVDTFVIELVAVVTTQASKRG